jgi:Ca2+-binding EF-hand superfamily protein
MKLYAELKKKNYSLEDFFGVLDKDKSKSLTLEEWTNGTKGYINDEESVALFRAIDVNKSGSLEFPEITQELISIRAAMALDSLEKVFVGGKSDAAAQIFEFDKDKSGTLDAIEFSNILDSVYRKLPREEFD